MTRARKAVGRITFVGAGPGDPGLLTAKATDAIRGADVIVVDTAVPAAVAAPAGVEPRSPEAAPAEIGRAAPAVPRSGCAARRRHATCATRCSTRAATPTSS